ncbi:MAG TPA: zf-HC2 domain-containing protein [Polyangiaceae bacterium]|nr:zf-HC2 domain-containing protein [Polyangiaceae bacterium]
MTVVGIHPEELFDKLEDGELSSAERERLRAHLDGCAVCRFEYAARLDFQAEALEVSLASPPPALPLRPLAPSDAEAELLAATVAAPRRRSRLVIWSLAAAALITASGAVASGLVGATPWHGLGRLFSQQAKPGEDAASVPKKLALAGLGAAAAPEAALAPSVEVALAAEQAPATTGSAADAASPEPAHHGKKARAAAAGTLLAALPPASGDMPSAKDGASKEPAAKEPSSAAKLFGEANEARRSGDVGRASGLYHLLQDQFPGSPEAELSRVTLAMLLLDNGDAQSALSGFERYLAGSSRGLEAEALVGRARALARLGRRNLEVSAWQEVQRKYPRSIYGRQATERLLALGLP